MRRFVIGTLRLETRAHDLPRTGPVGKAMVLLTPGFFFLGPALALPVLTLVLTAAPWPEVAGLKLESALSARGVRYVASRIHAAHFAITCRITPRRSPPPCWRWR